MPIQEFLGRSSERLPGDKDIEDDVGVNGCYHDLGSP